MQTHTVIWATPQPSYCYLRRRILLTLPLWPHCHFSSSSHRNMSAQWSNWKSPSPHHFGILFIAHLLFIAHKGRSMTTGLTVTYIPECSTTILAFLSPISLPCLLYFFCTQKAVLITCSNPGESIYHLEILL